METLGKELEGLFEEIEFIGVQVAESFSICCFNCLRTGATFCANTFKEVENRLEFIRKHFKNLTKKLDNHV